MNKSKRQLSFILSFCMLFSFVFFANLNLSKIYSQAPTSFPPPNCSGANVCDQTPNDGIYGCCFGACCSVPGKGDLCALNPGCTGGTTSSTSSTTGGW